MLAFYLYSQFTTAKWNLAVKNNRVLALNVTKYDKVNQICFGRNMDLMRIEARVHMQLV